jgi:hypothetical protein
MGKKITLALPIEVPEGKYCFNNSSGAICQFYNNEGGYGKCSLRFNINDDQYPCKKAEECLNLKEV